MQHHIVKVYAPEAFFLYDRVKDQPVQVFDWERNRWIEATDQEGYQPRFRVPFCPGKISFEEALHDVLAAQDRISPRDGYLLVLVAYSAPIEAGIRIGFATSPIPFEGQPVQAGSL